MGDNSVGKISPYKRTFSSFKNPAFRLYWGSLVWQQGAQNMQTFSRSLLVYRLTGSSAILGILALAQAIPQICLSLFGGVIADRVPKKYVMLIGQLVSALVAFGVALSLTVGYMSSERAGSWWILIVAAVFQGAIMGLTQPARESIIPQLVGTEQVMNAVALSMMSMESIRLIGPAATGFIIDTFSFEAVYYAMAGMSLMSVFFTAFLPRFSAESIRGASALTGIKEGLMYTRREITILFIIVHTFLSVLLVLPYTQLMPIFTEDILKVGASGMGVLMSVSGAGSIITSLVLASLPNKKRGLALLLSSIFMGFAVAVFSFSTSWSLSLAMMVLVGLGLSVARTMSVSLIQQYANPGYRGRVMSIFTMQLGMVSLGTFVTGMLAESIGPQWALGGFAMTLIFLSFLMLAFFSQLRRLD